MDTAVTQGFPVSIESDTFPGDYGTASTVWRHIS